MARKVESRPRRPRYWKRLDYQEIARRSELEEIEQLADEMGRLWGELNWSDGRESFALHEIADVFYRGEVTLRRVLDSPHGRKALTRKGAWSSKRSPAADIALDVLVRQRLQPEAKIGDITEAVAADWCKGKGTVSDAKSDQGEAPHWRLERMLHAKVGKPRGASMWTEREVLEAVAAELRDVRRSYGIREKSR